MLLSVINFNENRRRLASVSWDICGSRTFPLNFLRLNGVIVTDSRRKWILNAHQRYVVELLRTESFYLIFIFCGSTFFLLLSPSTIQKASGKVNKLKWPSNANETLRKENEVSSWLRYRKYELALLRRVYSLFFTLIPHSLFALFNRELLIWIHTVSLPCLQSFQCFHLQVIWFDELTESVFLVNLVKWDFILINFYNYLLWLWERTASNRWYGFN